MTNKMEIVIDIRGKLKAIYSTFRYYECHKFENL
jgi:hypothetical protein